MKVRPSVFWPGLLVGLFLINLTVVIVTISVATGDESFAVEPDYYDRALNYDREMQKRWRSESLGWSASLDIGHGFAVGGQRAISLRLAGPGSEPVGGATVRLAAFHHAAASQRREVVLVERAPGIYEGSIEMRERGAWRFEVSAARGGDQFQAVLEKQVAAEAAEPTE